jgi:hypothetical protein
VSYNAAYYRAYYERNRERISKRTRQRYAAKREEIRAYHRARRATGMYQEYDRLRHLKFYSQRWVSIMLSRAKTRAKRYGREFSLTARDVVIPDVCPALGIPLVIHVGRGGGRDDSPTLDRVDNEKGYVPGNVAVISAKANRIKSNATAEEIRKVADWLDRAMAGPAPAVVK